MNWWISLALLLAIGVICIPIAYKTYAVAPIYVALSAFCASFLVLLICIIGTVSAPKEVNTYQIQKTYIESHQAADPVENAALTSKKIELNEWLYTAQYSKNRWGGWSFYPEAVLEMEPIQ